MATKFAIAAASFLMSLYANATATSVTGAGGTAIYPVMQVWTQKYKAKTGVAINYQAIGSGGGIQQLEVKTVSFANSDKPLPHDELVRNHLVQFPQLMVAIVPVVHLPGIAAGRLVLDGPTLSRIYLGQVNRWNDPAIQALNPGLALPDMAVLPVYRSDSSGLTFNVTNYLGKVNPEWARKVGSDISVHWPKGTGAKGNGGVAGIVQRITGSIGYVEYAFARQSNLVWTGMVNADGERVQPVLQSFQAAAANADFSHVQDFSLILTNQPGHDSWPLTAATYMLMRTDNPADQNNAILRFLDYALHDGAADARRLDYVPFPDSLVNQIEASWKTSLKPGL